MKRKLVLVGWCIGVYFSLHAQCPGNDSIVRGIAGIRNSTLLPTKEKLTELLTWEKNLRQCSLHDSTFAILNNNIGLAYINEGDYLEGIRFINNAISFIRQKQGSPTLNPGYLSNCYYSLSSAYDALGNRSERMRTLDSCVQVATRLNVINSSMIYALILRAEYLYNIGDYKNCYSHALMAEKLSNPFAKTNAPNASYYASCVAAALGYKINALMALKEYDTAFQYYNALAEDYKKSGKDSLVGLAYGQLADIETEKGRYENAQSYLEMGLKYEMKYGSVANCKVMLNNLGVIKALRYKNPEMASEFYLKSYHYKRANVQPTLKDSMESVNALSNLGVVYKRKGLFDSAFYFFNLAYELVGKGWNEDRFLNSSQKEFTGFSKIDYLIKLLVAKAETLTEEYKSSHEANLLEEAIRMYTVTEKILFRLKMEQLNTDSKLSWRKELHLLLYENAIEACQLQGNIEAAFYFFERSKAVLLLDQLNEQRWTAQFDILKQNQLKKQITQLERRSEVIDKQSPGFDSIQREIFSKQQELERLQLDIRSNNPLYYQYSLDTSTIRIRDLHQTILRDHEALLEIFSGDSSVYILMVSLQKNEIIKLNKTLFDSLSTSFINCISNGEVANKNYLFCTSVSSQLYNLVFGSLGLPTGRIIVSPDGKYFPFEALVTGNRNGQPLYFMEDHAVSYTYSVRYLMNAFEGNRSFSARNFMGIAPVSFSATLGLPSLPGSDQSLDKVESHFSRSDHLLNANATRSNFLQNFYRYKVIQLYTHATDSGSAKEPVIYFSDSALLLSDLLYENKPATNLIVLSACETGSGKLYEGEGVFGFNRGFAAIGIPSSVANLWQVENTSTYRLTELFYDYLSKGLPVDISLQKAKIDFIKSAPHEKQLPYYWAAPVLIGRTDPIKFSKSYTLIYILAGLVIFGLVFGGIQLVKRKIKTNSL